jgi:recombination DNA repair RAD52 pathway protein
MWSKNEKSGRMEADEDAPKKAMTDALTKGLSHLGFSADVFLGLFDDNRYVQKMQKEFSQPAAQAPDLAQDEDVKQGAINWMRDERSSLNVMTIAEEVKDWRKRKAKPLAKLEANYPDIYEQLMQTYDLALERVTGRVQ